MESISCIAAAVTAFAVSAILGKFLIPFLRKIKFGQTIKEIGPVGIRINREPLIWADLCLSWALSSEF